MKKIVVVFLALAITATAYAAEIDRNLHKLYKGMPEIKVYLKNVTSTADDAQVKTGVFKKVFDEVLEKRLNIKFVPVEDVEQPDVIVTAMIKKYVFTEKALPSFFGTYALVADTTAAISAAKLVVDYEIINSRTGKVITVFKNFTTDTRRPIEDMKGENGFKYAVEKNANRFIYRAFYKQKKM